MFLFQNLTHCLKYNNFTRSPGVEIMRKGTVSIEFRRDGSRTASTSMMELFVIIVNGFQQP